MAANRKVVFLLVLAAGCGMLAGLLLRTCGAPDLRSLVNLGRNVPGNTPKNTDQNVKRKDSNKYVQRFVMTKVEKTGSSTLRGILARFIMINKLNVLTSCKGHHITWTNNNTWRIGPHEEEQADALVNHAIHNKTFLKKYMKPGYKHIALVREPVSWFKSAVRFYTHPEVNEIKNRVHYSATGSLRPEVVASNDSLFFVGRRHPACPDTWFHLGQLQWYGFKYADRNNITAINRFIASLISQVDVIMLYDQLDASLVMLKRKFHWSYLDIFYKSYGFTTTSKEPLSAKSVARVLARDANLGDKLLYDSMNRTWWNQPELAEQHFWKEVEYFKKLNAEVNAYCWKKDEEKDGVFIIPASEWHGALPVTHQLCYYLHVMKSDDEILNQINGYADEECTF